MNWPTDYLDPLPALQDYELVYMPAFNPSGSPKDPTASKQVLAEEQTARVQALNIDAAVDRFEREQGHMVVTGKRLQFDGAGA